MDSLVMVFRSLDLEKSEGYSVHWVSVRILNTCLYFLAVSSTMSSGIVTSFDPAKLFLVSQSLKYCLSKLSCAWPATYLSCGQNREESMKSKDAMWSVWNIGGGKLGHTWCQDFIDEDYLACFRLTELELGVRNDNPLRLCIASSL